MQRAPSLAESSTRSGSHWVATVSATAATTESQIGRSRGRFRASSFEALRGVGVELLGQPGEMAPYDPSRHSPLSGDAAPTPGQPVVVRLVGLSYLDPVVRRAGVEPADGGES